MRILLACAQFPPTKSGYAQVAGNLAAQYEKAGHRVALLTEGHGCVRRGRVAFLTPEGRRLVADATDIVQIIGPTPVFTEQVAIEAAHAGIPSVYNVYAFAGLSTYHGNRLFTLVDAVYSNTYYRFALGRVTRAVSSTKGFADRFTLFSGEWTTIPNGVNDPCVDAGTLTPAPRDDRGSRSLRILFVGQLRPYKSVETLLRAVAVLAQTRTDIEVTIVGDGPDRARLEGLADQFGIRSVVSFTGALSDERLHDQYLRNDLLVLPSVRGESFGIVLLEAGLHGLRVIASNLVGVREVVHEVGGTLVPPGDVLKLSGALSSEHPIPTRSRALRLDLAKSYSWDSIGSSYLTLFEAVLRTSRLKPKR